MKTNDIKISDGTKLVLGRYVKIGDKSYKFMGFESDINMNDKELLSGRCCVAGPEPECRIKVKDVGDSEFKAVDTWDYDGEVTDLQYGMCITKMDFLMKNLMAFMDANDDEELSMWKNISQKDKTKIKAIHGLLTAYVEALD